MSITASIGGRQASGKSTIAAQLGLLLAYVLDLPENFSIAGDKSGCPGTFALLKSYPDKPLLAAVHERNRGSAVAYRHAQKRSKTEEKGFVIARHEELLSIGSHAAAAAGGVFVADAVTSWYDHIVSRWVDESNAARERAGRNLQAFIGPDGFREINGKYLNALAATQQLPAATIFVHQEGSEMVKDDDFGLIGGASTRLRGQAESGADCHIVLHLKGGFRSGDRRTGERRIEVVSDAACLAVGAARELPALRTPKDFATLRRLLWETLAPSLLWLRSVVAEEDAEWSHLSEAVDDLPGARRGGERSEAARLLDQMQTELAKWGLTSSSAAVVAHVRPLLTDCTGWGSLTAAGEHGASVEILRKGIEILRERAPRIAEQLVADSKAASPKKMKAADPAAASGDFSDIPQEL